LQNRLDCAALLGRPAVEALRRATQFLTRRTPAELLPLVGSTLPELALARPPADKRLFPASYGGGGPCSDDILTGRGVFFITENGKLMLDCVSGHYQMVWGYNDPQLNFAAAEALRLGVVWDNHSNTPGLPVKLLAEEIAKIAKGTSLNCVLLGVCTGSVACATALKIMLLRHRRDARRAKLGKPVIVVLEGNYHGTDIAMQALRRMWPGLVTGMEIVPVEPNDTRGLEQAFSRHDGRIAGFWAEPVMMNREAILLEDGFLQRARRLCTQHGALLALDEIQTGFWYPDVFCFRRMKIEPDIVVLGKGLTAGFHPLSGLLYRRELDLLEQYDAISTNGNASLAALVALGNLHRIRREAKRIRALETRYFQGLRRLVERFPHRLERVNGCGLLAGLKFQDRADAIAFQNRAVERGLWLRVHAYHPGHRTVLTKLSLAADARVAEFVLKSLEELLSEPYAPVSD
jgi:adenosylmethionine-8-amino-7-oxononanoate aminotransferase